MTLLTVTLPWPDPGLSLNSRLHYRKTAELKRGARMAGRVLTLETLGLRPLPFSKKDRLKVVAVYYPPDERKRDLFENMPGSCKAFMDGIFDALEINDNQVRATSGEWGKVCSGGQVVFGIMTL